MGCGSGKTKDRTIKGKKFAFPKCQDTITLDEAVYCMAILDEKTLLVGIKEVINKLDLDSKKLTPMFNEHQKSVNFLLRLSSGKIASASQDKTIKIWDTGSNQSVATLTGHKSMIWSLTETAEGLVSASDDKSSILWDLSSNSQISKFQEESREVYTCCTLNDGRVATGGGFNSVKIWNMASKTKEGEIDMGCVVWTMIQLQDGRLAVGLGNGDINLVDLGEMKTTAQLQGHKKNINSLIELTGNRLVSASDDHDMILWNTDDPSDKTVFKDGHNEEVVSLVTIDGFKFISASNDKTIKIWE